MTASSVRAQILENAESRRLSLLLRNCASFIGEEAAARPPRYQRWRQDLGLGRARHLISSLLEPAPPRPPPPPPLSGTAAGLPKDAELRATVLREECDPVVPVPQHERAVGRHHARSGARVAELVVRAVGMGHRGTRSVRLTARVELQPVERANVDRACVRAPRHRLPCAKPSVGPPLARLRETPLRKRTTASPPLG